MTAGLSQHRGFATLRGMAKNLIANRLAGNTAAR
jgi:hypothetical protein